MLVFSKTDKNIVISGKTFYAKEAIKALGGTWDHATSSWTISSNINSETLKDLEEVAKEGVKKEKNDKKMAAAFAKSPEGIAKLEEEERLKILACLEQKKKDGSFHWICCEKVKVIDWGRQHTSCQACAEWSGQSWNTFRVRGSIFTGD
jgi:hypothetical protein